NLNLPSLDNNWVLVWYGTNSHFAETKKPMYYSRGWPPYTETSMPVSFAYQADEPLLITFQNSPSSIAATAEGGITLNFATNAGNMSLLPLFGRNLPTASETESWGTGGVLPS